VTRCVCIREAELRIGYTFKRANIKLNVIVDIRKVDWSEILKQDESIGRGACRSVQMTVRTHTTQTCNLRD